MGLSVVPSGNNQEEAAWISLLTPPISGELSESAAWVWLSVEVANG
jgi:hypothetical protein